MTEDRHAEPLDDDLKALLAHERRRSPAPAAARAAVSRGLAAAIADGVSAPRGPDGGAPGGFSWLRGGGPVALALVLGAGIGAALHAALAPSRVVVVEAPPTVATVSAAPPLESAVPREPTGPAVAPSGSPAPIATPSVASSRATGLADAGALPAAVPSGADDLLRRERVQLEVARAGLARGDAASALDALTKHATEYPDGKLAEERDAMVIQALMSAGRTAEAAERASSFRKRYPNSFFWSGIQASLGGRATADGGPAH